MNKANLLKETQRTRMLENAGLNQLQGTNFISVDIQPEYQDYLGFRAWDFGAYVNEVFDGLHTMTFLFNGPDMGFGTEEEYRWWLVENCGVEEENVAASYFYDKGYAFFRFCMDEGIDDDELVDFIKFMISHDINDSRDIDEEMWQAFMQEYGYQDIQDLLEPAGDMINIPEVMEFLKPYGGKIVVTGGGIQECLKEVELALMALSKPYEVLTQWTY